MISEFIMSKMGWDAVWYLGGGGLEPGQNPPPGHHRWWHRWSLGSVFVGTWTGPDGDLVCVKRCQTRDEANRWLSPPAHTVLDGCARSFLVWAGNTIARELQDALVQRRAKYREAHPIEYPWGTDAVSDEPAVEGAAYAAPVPE